MTDAPQLAPGLYIVAVPIGAARDITLRALDTLAAAEMIAAEDTRSARRLLGLHGIALGGRPLVAYHDHNGPKVRPKLLAALQEGRSVAYVSDAGTPLVADPGYALVRDAVAEGIAVHPVPGPSAPIAALSVAGLPTDRFLFAGFLPTTEAARRKAVEELAEVPATLVFFEAAQRCSANLRCLVSVLGGDRRAALCRELTKTYEEVRRGTLAELLDGVEADPPRGEVVLVVDRGARVVGPEARDAALMTALETLSVREAVAEVSRDLGLPRREVYQAALALVKST